MEYLSGHGEREMLIRYCARFTHDWFLAEDLAQQTLLESWLKFDHLYSQEVHSSWLIGVARNVCLRWVRRQRQARIFTMSELSAEVEDSFEDDVDVEEECERRELALLIERGISSLPTQTRTVLVQYYLESIPQAEIAARLGTTVEAVEARIRRGKRALRHLLTHELREEAASFGFITAESIAWQQTRIWCPICGQRQLLTRLPEPPGTVSFRCPGCNDDPEGIGWAYALSNPRFVQRLAGLTQPKAILRRFTSWAYEYYATAAWHRGVVACAQCGREHRLHLALPAHLSESSHPHAERYGLSGQCPSCGWQDYCSPSGLLQSLPSVQGFWQAHHRMRLVFHEPISEAVGQPAWVASFESMTSAARLDVLLGQETLNLIDVHAHSL